MRWIRNGTVEMSMVGRKSKRRDARVVQKKLKVLESKVRIKEKGETRALRRENEKKTGRLG